ncbi:MAG: hypothetical protein PQJ46_06475 [Spirochaetales bacterium]|nr:hypothetical protein [Spirochaetales bacterium]
MKTEKAFNDYYQNLIKEVEVPPCPSFEVNENPVYSRKNTWAKLVIAAILIMAVFPSVYRLHNPSVLAVRAAESTKKNQINSRIQNGLTEFKYIASYSFISGGKE